VDPESIPGLVDIVRLEEYVMGAENLLKPGLGTSGAFTITVEYTVPDVAEPFADDLAKLAEFVGQDTRVAGMALTDRVPSLTTHDTVDLAVRAAAVSGKMPLVHISGKNRNQDNLREQLQRLIDHGLQNALMITGDEPRSELEDPIILVPAGFTDSVQAIDFAKQTSPDLFVAGAVSSFKYSVAAQTMQYIKMQKKLDRGCDAIYNQVGLDMRKVHELILFAQTQGIGAPIVQALYWPTAVLAKLALQDELPGVVATEAMHEFLKGLSSDPDKGKGRRTRILALQVALCRTWGYAGVHIGGIKSPANIKAVLDAADEMAATRSGDQLWTQWQELWKTPEGQPVATAPANGFYWFKPDGNGLNLREETSVDAPAGASLKYRFMQAIHDVFFSGSMTNGGRMQRLCLCADRRRWLRGSMYRFERACKYPLVQCQGCGSCSLPETAYVCVEASCAKKLPNGPCGGSKVGDECEVRPGVTCAWVKIYRQAHHAGGMGKVAQSFIPAKNVALKHTCSWISMAANRDHRALGLPKPQTDDNPSNK